MPSLVNQRWLIKQCRLSWGACWLRGGVLTQGLRGHLEHGSGSAPGTRGLPWAQEGLLLTWGRPVVWSSLAPAPLSPLMISSGGIYRNLGCQLRGIQKTHPYSNVQDTASFHIFLPVPTFQKGYCCPVLL